MSNRKQHSDIYNYAINKLNLDHKSSIAIENTLESCNSSIEAKLHTLFYPGEYSFFKDSDNSMQYSYGTIDPYKASEWFYNFQDTVKIRSNWDIELQEIKLDLEF